MANPNYVFTKGADGASYEPKTITELGGMIGKISEQVIREVSAEDKLSVFDKMPSENGDTIEQAVVKLANARAYDKTGANALSRKTPDIAVKYFNDWTRTVFDTTVDVPEMRKVLTTGKGVSDLSSKVVGVLSESDKFEKYTQTKNLLQWGRQDKAGKVLKLVETIEYETTGVNYKKVLTALKNAVSGMQYVNSNFNTGNIKRSTKASDIYILMPYKLKNSLDVEELAGVFNLDKAELKSRIIEIDAEPETISSHSSYSIYIVDKMAILKYTRLYEMVDQKNADGLFWNYFLHTERLYGISPLFDACYINVNIA